MGGLGALVGKGVDVGLNSMEDAARNAAYNTTQANLQQQVDKRTADLLAGLANPALGMEPEGGWGIGGSGPGTGYGSQGETGPGGTSFGSDLGYDTPTSGDTSTPSDTSGMDAAGGSADLLAKGGIAGLAARYAQGGYSLGDYSDGGRLLKGPGDGVSDDIPATIADKQPARLADGEFVVPARIVSELGNGSTEAGARKLYAMMDRIQKARAKSVGKNKVAVNSRAETHLPA
jgi:hypothetical protein